MKPPLNIAGYDPTRDAGDCRWDGQAADWVVNFFPSCLSHVKGHAGSFELAQWERDVIATLFGWKRPDGTRRYREALIAVPRKNGKGLALDTPIPCPSGWTTMGELMIGDTLYDDNGLECKVTFVSDVKRIDCYAITFSNGERIECDGDHLWKTSARIARPGKGHDNSTSPAVAIRTTRDLAKTVYCGARQDRNHSLAMPSPLSCDEAMLPVDPYVLGAWLGDGTTESATITAGSVDAAEMAGLIESRGYDVQIHEYKQRECKLQLRSTVETLFGRRPVGKHEQDNLQKTLRRISVLGNKHIPRAYLRASCEQRIELLRGLMDTDGHVSKSGISCQYSTILPSLRDGMSELLASLGIKHAIKTKQQRCNGRLLDTFSYQIQFACPRSFSVFCLSRKANRVLVKDRIRRRSETVQITKVEPIETIPTKCIQVDSPSKMFLAGRTMLPTHNTTICAGLGLYLLECDKEKGPEVYCAASTRDQATLVFDSAATMVRQSQRMQQRLLIHDSVKRIISPKTGGFLRAIPAEAAASHGFNASAVIFDELHTQPNRDLYDVLKTSQGARNQPLFISITTAGHDRHSICWEVWEYARNVRDGVIKDPYFLPIIYELDSREDWKNKDVWRRVNPNYGISIKQEYLDEAFERAQQLPSYENTFRNLHLNQWTEQATRWFSLDAWDGCNNGDKILPGEDVWCGLDLSTTTDLSALSLVATRPDGVACDAKFWVPAEQARIRSARDRVPYRQWIDQGWITATPGTSVDYDVIRRDINEMSKLYNIRTIAIDRWNATQLAKQLEADGFNIELFGQGFASMSSPSKEMQRLIADKHLYHDGNPVLRWMAANVMLEIDAASNIKPSKNKSSERIDGIVALIMAIGVHAKEAANSVWDADEVGL